MKSPCTLHRLTPDECSRYSSLFSNDICFAYGEYYPKDLYGRMQYEKGLTSFISNIKKPICKKGETSYKYKEKCIQKMANLLARDFRTSLIPELHGKKFIFLPIPPSREKADPGYDDRLLQILSLASLPYHEFILQKKTSTPYHCSTLPRDRAVLESNYLWNELKGSSSNFDVVIIFDDVLTTGTHFKTCQEMVIRHLPNISVIGLFIANTIHEIDTIDDFPILP